MQMQEKDLEVKRQHGLEMQAKQREMQEKESELKRQHELAMQEKQREMQEKDLELRRMEAAFKLSNYNVKNWRLNDCKSRSKINVKSKR